MKRAKLDGVDPREQLVKLGFTILARNGEEPRPISEATLDECHLALDALRAQGVRVAGLRL